MEKLAFRRVLFSSVAVLGLAAAQPAFAQDAKNNDSGQPGDDIIVTARRSEERLQDVPISISVVTADTIAKRNIGNATELSTFVPSLSSSSNFGPEKSSFAIRGFTQEGKTSPSVGVYFADVVAPRANAGTTSGNGAGPGSFFDLENVQVLKGPQGTLFGRNTTGGAILLVPARPKDNLEGSLDAAVGNYNLRRLQGMINIPLADTFQMRAAFDWNRRDGYLKNISGIGPDRLGDMNYFAGRVSLLGQLTPDLENYTIFSFSNSHNHGVVPNLRACNTGTIPGVAPPEGVAALLSGLACAQIAQEEAAGADAWTVQSTDPHPFQRVKQWQVINTTTWQASDTLSVKNIVSYAEYRESSSFSLWGTKLTVPDGLPSYVYDFLGAPGTIDPTIQIDAGPSGYNASQSTFTEEFQLHGHTGDGRLDWQAGAYLEVSKPLGYSSGAASVFLDCTNVSTYQCSNPLGFGTISSYNIKDIFNNKALYAQANYKITDNLTLTGGFRYTIDKMYDDDINVNVFVPTPGSATFTCQNIIAFNNGTLENPVPVVASGELDPTCRLITRIKNKAPTWLIDLDYRITPNAMVYAKYSRGYRQGAINPNNLGFPSWGPEKVDTYEVGAKTSFRGMMPGYFNIAAFYNNFQNQQLSVDPVIADAYQNSVPPQQLVLNAGKSRIWGIEVDASVRPFTGFKLDVGYSYLNTKLQSFTIPALPVYYRTLAPEAEIGGPLALAPKNRVTVTGSYTLPLAESVGEVSLGVSYTYTDPMRSREPLLSPLLYEIPASNLVNVNVDWNSVLGQPIDLGFFMTNLTNEDHILFPDGAWGTIGAEGGHPELPRMFGFRAKVHFGT